MTCHRIGMQAPAKACWQTPPMLAPVPAGGVTSRSRRVTSLSTSRTAVHCTCQPPYSSLWFRPSGKYRAHCMHPDRGSHKHHQRCKLAADTIVCDKALVHNAVLCLVGILELPGGLGRSTEGAAGRDACGQTAMAASCQSPPSLCLLGRCLCSCLMLNRTEMRLLPRGPPGHLPSQCAVSQGCPAAWTHLCEAAALGHSGQHDDDAAAALLHHLPKVSCGGLLGSLQADL